jgi:Kef-type K+ transport system membrane component KefB
MPFILLIFGLLIGGYALYKFLRRASRDEAQKILLTLAICLMICMILVMVIVGRVAIAALLTAVLIPLVARLWMVFNKGKTRE